MYEDHNIPHELWSVTFKFNRILDGGLAEKLSDALEDAAETVLLHNSESADGDNWSVTLTCIGKPDVEGIFARIAATTEEAGVPPLLTEQDVIAEILPEKDWLQHVHDNFPPVRIGSFFIYGSHYTGDMPADAVPLKIDAATAFGSGEHETTRGCIQALEKLKATQDFKRGLDMGCGSGILAIAMTKLWPAIRVNAVDIEEESVVVSKRHAMMNGAEKSITAECGDGYNTQLAQSGAPYDVVAANILANPLIEMAPQLAKALRPGGFAVLSGLLARQEADVVAAHEKAGLKLIDAEKIADWRALVLQKP